MCVGDLAARVAVRVSARIAAALVVGRAMDRHHPFAAMVNLIVCCAEGVDGYEGAPLPLKDASHSKGSPPLGTFVMHSSLRCMSHPQTPKNAAWSLEALLKEVSWCYFAEAHVCCLELAGEFSSPVELLCDRDLHVFSGALVHPIFFLLGLERWSGADALILDEVDAMISRRQRWLSRVTIPEAHDPSAVIRQLLLTSPAHLARVVELHAMSIRADVLGTGRWFPAPLAPRHYVQSSLEDNGRHAEGRPAGAAVAGELGDGLLAEDRLADCS